MGDEMRHGGRGDGLGALVGPLWFAGWLFTLGLLHLPFGRAIVALVIWPYYIGASLHH
jgi:hypothetical protein